MSTSYPRVHVVGSGAYYSYRPLTRFIEKVERNHFRENSSKPKDFTQYLEAIQSSHGNGYSRAPARDWETLSSRSASQPSFSSNTGKPPSLSNNADNSKSKVASKNKRLQRYFEQDLELENELRRDEEYLRQKELEREKKEMAQDMDEDIINRLRRKHPYRLPVEDEVVPPHESSVWPQNRKHFDLVSSYDVMMDYLGIREKNEKQA